MRLIPLSLAAALLCVPSLCVATSNRSVPAQLSGLPAAAKSNISAALGLDTAEYHLRPIKGGFEAANSHGPLAIRFTARGVSVSSGTASWAMTLRGYGYGDALKTVSAAPPRANPNRVEYRRHSLTEWYINGPAGLEQGFTIAERPDKSNGQPLTIALALSLGLSAVVDETRMTARLNSRNGESLRYTGLSAQDAKGRRLEAWLESQPGSLLLRISDTDAEYPIVVDPWVELAELTASDGPQTFGAIAIDGNTIVVGAPYETIGINQNQGAAYVFVKPTSGWSNMTQTAKLTASDGNANAYFGRSVAISGSTIVVGANGAAVFPKHNVGAAYVFVEPAAGWVDTTETAELKYPHDFQNNGHFGNGVATDGTTVAVGWTSFIGTGAVYVFVKPSTGWKTGMMYQAVLTTTDGYPPGFGDAIAMSGGTLVAGAPYGSGVTVNYPGAAYVFVEPATGWVSTTETAKLTSSDAHKNSWVGYSVAINNDTIVVGAPLVQWERGVDGPGGAYVFVKPTSGWANMTETAELRAMGGQKGDQLGTAVAFDGRGETLWLGAPGRSSVQGAVYVFAKPTTGWSTTTRFNAEILSPGPPSFGQSISIFGDTETIIGNTTVFVFGPQ